MYVYSLVPRLSWEPGDEASMCMTAQYSHDLFSHRFIQSYLQCMLVVVWSQTLPFQQYKYAEGGGGRVWANGLYPLRRAGILFYTSMQLKGKRISVCAKLQASIAQLGHV